MFPPVPDCTFTGRLSSRE